jgi:phosphopantetheinyl transferase
MFVLKLSLLHLSENFSVTQQIIEQLPEPQQIRLRSLKGGKRRSQFIAGRLLLVKHLTSAFAVSDNNWAIEEHAGTAPVIKGVVNAPKFSLSHSGNAVGLALLSHAVPSSTLLGLDIEQLVLERRLKSAHYFCNSEQLQQIKMKPCALEKRQLMTRLWTQKEACFKAHGQSVLNSNLQALSFEKAVEETANLHSSSWQNALAYTHLSIYCDAPYHLQLQHFQLDSSGELVKLQCPVINWLQFRVTNDWLFDQSS